MAGGETGGVPVKQSAEHQFTVVAAGRRTPLDEGLDARYDRPDPDGRLVVAGGVLELPGPYLSLVDQSGSDGHRAVLGPGTHQNPELQLLPVR